MKRMITKEERINTQIILTLCAIFPKQEHQPDWILCAILPKVNKKEKIDLILRGFNIDDDVFLKTKSLISKAVQTCIIKTERLSIQETED